MSGMCEMGREKASQASLGSVPPVRVEAMEVANWLQESEQEDPVLCPGNLWNQSSAFSRGRKFRTGSSSYFLVLLAAPLKAFALPKTYL